MSLDVLVPHFRDARGLALSLASVAEQSWTGDIRLVIVDDGSPAAEFRAVEALAAEQPLPVALARNPAEPRPALHPQPPARHGRGRLCRLDRLRRRLVPDEARDASSTISPGCASRARTSAGSGSPATTTGSGPAGGRASPHQKVAPEPLRELLLGAHLRAYLWTLLGSAATFRAVGHFDERLPRLQDLDYFIRFLRAGGVLAVPRQQMERALCRYHKSDIGRNAAEIRRCNQLIFEKYRTSFERYGPDFLATIRYNAETLSARYAKNNGDQLARARYFSRAFAANPRRGLGLARSWIAQGGQQLMRLHVLAGSAELLRPAVLGQDLAARLFGPDVRLAAAGWAAGWLERNSDDPYHDFLRDGPGDRRVEIFARALRQDFGARFAPLIVLPDLLSEAPALAAAEGTGPDERLSGLAVLERLWAHGGSDAIRLTAIALPATGPEGVWDDAGTVLAPGAAVALEALRTACMARGLPAHAVETQVIEMGPERGVLAVPWRNALAGRLAAAHRGPSRGGRPRARSRSGAGRARTPPRGLVPLRDRACLPPAPRGLRPARRACPHRSSLGSRRWVRRRREAAARICFVIDRLARRSGGAERVLVETANALRRPRPRGADRQPRGAPGQRLSIPPPSA